MLPTADSARRHSHSPRQDHRRHGFRGRSRGLSARRRRGRGGDARYRRYARARERTRRHGGRRAFRGRGTRSHVRQAARRSSTCPQQPHAALVQKHKAKERVSWTSGSGAASFPETSPISSRSSPQACAASSARSRRQSTGFPPSPKRRCEPRCRSSRSWALNDLCTRSCQDRWSAPRKRGARAVAGFRDWQVRRSRPPSMRRICPTQGGERGVSGSSLRRVSRQAPVVVGRLDAALPRPRFEIADFRRDVPPLPHVRRRRNSRRRDRVPVRSADSRAREPGVPLGVSGGGIDSDDRVGPSACFNARAQPGGDMVGSRQARLFADAARRVDVSRARSPCGDRTAKGASMSASMGISSSGLRRQTSSNEPIFVECAFTSVESRSEHHWGSFSRVVPIEGYSLTDRPILWQDGSGTRVFRFRFSPLDVSS